MKNDNLVISHWNLMSNIATSLKFAGSLYLSKGQVIHLQKMCKNLAATPTSHTVPCNWRLHQQFENVFKCLLEVSDQQAEAKKPPAMKVMGGNEGSSSEEDDDNDHSACLDPPAPKGRDGNNRNNNAAHLHGGGDGGAAVKAEEPIELLSSSQDL